MAAREAITALYRSPKVDECIRRIAPRDQVDDIKQQAFEVLLLKDGELIEGMAARGELIYYLVKTVINLSSRRYNQIREITTADVSVYGDDADDEVVECSPDIECVVATMDDAFGTFYHRVILQLVAEHGSNRKVSKITGIPRASINQTMSEVREYIKRCLTSQP